MSSIFKYLSGRHTAFAVYFTAMGTVLAWFHRLDTNFIMLIGAVQCLVLGHSIQENYFKKTDNGSNQPSATPAPVDGDSHVSS
jgi:hypothetical protein